MINQKFPRNQIVYAVFFLLWAGNCILSHATGREFLNLAQEWRLEQEAAQVVDDDGEQPIPPISSDAQTRGTILMVTNLPLFVGMGFQVRAENPAPGVLYWILVLIGSVYIPFILSICVFLLINFPGSGSAGFPGTVDRIEDLEDEDDEDEW